MSYTPTPWATGDTVTAEKLNNMETGIDAAVNPFIVTCTPTAQDYSGTMDKTVAEIDAAFNAGKKITFKVMTGATTFLTGDVITTIYAGGSYPSYIAYAIDAYNNILIRLYTGTNAIGTRATYGTNIYTLTPAS